MTDREHRGRTRAEHQVGRRYVWELSGGVIAFLLLFTALPAVVTTTPGTAWNTVVALVPILPVIWMAIALARHVRRVDELQRVILLRSFSFGFGASMVIAIAIALLDPAGAGLQHGEWAVFIGGMSAWGISLAVYSARASR